LDKLDSPETRLWYAEQTLPNGCSKDILAMQIESMLHEQLGKAEIKAILEDADAD